MAYARNKILKLIGFSPTEWQTILQKSSKAGMRTTAYIRRMAVDGEIKIFNLKEISDVRLALIQIGRNVNQVAKAVNSTGTVYQGDMENLQKQIRECQIIMENWLEPLEMEVK